MNTYSVAYPIILSSLLLAGCNPKSSDLAAIPGTMIVGPEFSPNKGLFVPEDTRRSLGLKIVEVGEHHLVGTLDLSLRIYEKAGESVLASGLVGPEQVKSLKVGQVLQVRTVDGQNTTAKITAIEGKTQKATGSVEVLVEMPQSTGFTVGSFVTATTAMGEGETVTTVPRSALVQATDGYFVYTVSGKHFARTPVKIGVLGGDQAEIREGLYSGDQVVAEPAMSLWMIELAAVKGGQACCAVPGEEK